MIGKFCRILCLIFLIGDFHSSLSQYDDRRIVFSNLNINNQTIASLNDVKHQASIRLIEKDAIFGEGHICSGSLISPRVVLTAARCLINSSSNEPRHPAELIVVLGTFNRYQRIEQTVISKVTHIRYPTSFDLKTMRDDIGLIFLSNGIPEKHLTIRPIELSRTMVDVNMKFAVTGWDNSLSRGKSQLLAANTTVADADTCATAIGTSFLPKGMFCAKFTIDMYQSDIGSPVVSNGKLIGLSSRTTECSKKDNEQVILFTDVAYHIKWIQRELADEKNTDGSIWGLLGFLALTCLAFRDKQKHNFRL